jgi:hypothetical protein
MGASEAPAQLVRRIVADRGCLGFEAQQEKGARGEAGGSRSDGLQDERADARHKAVVRAKSAERE